MKDKILEAYEETVLNEQINQKDPSGEREGFVMSTINRAHQLMDVGVLDRSEVKKITDAVKKIVKF